MGRKKDKAGKVGGEPKRARRIPKEIAGIAVPKDLRRAGEALLDKASSPQGKAMIATGLGIAATVAAAAIEGSRAKAAEPKPANDAGRPQSAGPEALGEAMGSVVDAVLSRFLGGARKG